MIFVLGADDPLGEAVVREALAAGLPVTATTPRALGAGAEGVAGPADAAVLALTPSPGRAPSTRMTDLALATTAALRSAGISRLVAASSAALSSPRSRPRSLRPGRRRGGVADAERLERVLAGSGLDWTALRAGATSDVAGAGDPRISPAVGRASALVPREDLARALLDLAGRPGASPRVLEISRR